MHLAQDDHVPTQGLSGGAQDSGEASEETLGLRLSKLCICCLFQDALVSEAEYENGPMLIRVANRYAE